MQQGRIYKVRPLCKNALKVSGYTTSLKYATPLENTSRNRNPKKIWLNQPFRQDVKTNIDKIFIKLIKKYFAKDHKLHKIFNTNIIKLSCSCMSNVSRNLASCPLDGKCLTKNIVYKAVVSTITGSHTYYGSCDDFKFHNNNHTKAFRHQHCKNNTELSKHIWDPKNAGILYNFTRSIAAYASACRCGTRRCDLCITEMYITVRANKKNLLNKRTEIISKCRNRNKFILKNIK